MEVTDVSAEYAMLALQGPRAVEVLGGLLEGDVPARFRHAEATVAGVPALVCRTGYTGEDGVELLIEPGGATAVWDALLEAGAAPAGLGARDTLRLEVCYPLYGNDLSTERTPIEAGLKWACALDTDFVGVERLREQAEQGTAEQLAPFVFTGQGIPRPGCAVLHDGEPVGTVTSGTLSPCMDVGIGMAYVRADLAEPGHRCDRRRARKAASRARLEEAPLRKGRLTLADNYPDDLLYHSEHDWVRIEGDEATFGITWYAQDALGEVVFYDPPEVGATVDQGRVLRRGGVGEGGVRRDRADVGRGRRR